MNLISRCKRLLIWISKRRYPYHPLINIEISREKLLHNIDKFRKLAPNGSIAAVLKSNAYGHGLLEVANVLEENSDSNKTFFIVDSYFEAILLRNNRITTPILIIGYTRTEDILLSHLRDVAFTVTSLDMLKLLEMTTRTIHIHLKIDTGMNRQGLMTQDIDQAIDILKKSPKIILEGICTHLSDSDNKDPSFTHTQLILWNKIAKRFKSEFPTLRWIHASATYGHKYSTEIDANISRLGIGLYGLPEENSSLSHLNLEPVLEMKTIITGLKTLQPGEVVGYSNTFKADKKMLIATIPAGYYEGVDRRQSNRGAVLVGPDRIVCPIIGRISMNITTIDISGIPQTKLNDPVVVISANISDPNSIVSIVKKSEGTITHELAVGIPAHLKRVIIK